MEAKETQQTKIAMQIIREKQSQQMIVQRVKAHEVAQKLKSFNYFEYL